MRSTDDVELVGQAPDPLLVLDLAKKLRPDVVIISIRMVLRIGLENFQNTLGHCCKARLLVLVPCDDRAFFEHVIASGAAGYLTEQACSEVLLAAIRSVHAKEPFSQNGTNRIFVRPSSTRNGSILPPGETTSLTPRERQVLQLVAEGFANKQTAGKLCISIKTVEKHRQRLMDKLGIHETAGLTRYALYAGFI